MPEKINWKKLCLENWIPRIGPALLTLIGIAVIGPYVQDIYMQNSNFHEDRKHFYNEFTQNFGELRASAREMLLACKEDSTRDVKEYQHKLQTSYDKLWVGTFNVETFFSKESADELYKFLSWFDNQHITCINIDSVFNLLLVKEREIRPRMRILIYGKQVADK